MPWSKKQHAVFAAIAHGWKPKKGSLKSISRSEAQKMASEGVRRGVEAKKALGRRS